MEKAQRILLLKSETAAAIHHALSRWRALMCYIEDGMLQIDNSAAERVACPMLCTSENVRVAQR